MNMVYQLDIQVKFHVQYFFSGRTFFPDRIRVHQKSCKGSGENNSSSSVKKNNSNNKNNKLMGVGGGGGGASPAPSAVHKLVGAAANAATENLALLSSPQPVKRMLHRCAL